MAWVRFPDGSRRKVERVEKPDALADLDALITLRAQAEQPEPPRRRLPTLAEVIEAWFADGCPNVAATRSSRHARVKSPNTIANARQLLGTSVLPAIGSLKVDRTTTQRLEGRVLRVVFSDGLIRELDFAGVSTGVLAALDDDQVFGAAAVDGAAGTRTSATMTPSLSQRMRRGATRISGLCP
jgi:hypothetical protein